MAAPGKRLVAFRVLLATAAIGIAAAAAEAADVTVEKESGVFYVSASVQALAPANTCYSVLTDFDHLAEFVPGMRSSRVVSQPGEMLRIEQVGVTGPALFGLTVRTTLGLSLAPPGPGREGRIDFSSLGGNLRQMHGAWQVRDDKAGCRIDYRATIEPDFPVPPLIGTLVMRLQIEGQLDAIAREVAKRHAHGEGSPVETRPLQ